MVKHILIAITALISYTAFSQREYPSQFSSRKEFVKDNRRRTFKKTMWQSGNPGIYLGPTLNYEVGQFTYGGELKSYTSIYDVPILSVSAYSNYSYSPHQEELTHNVGFGGHLGVFGLETNYRFGEEASLWSLTPQVLVDFGNLRLSYGYDFRLINNSSVRRHQMHRISLKYAINLESIVLGIRRKNYDRR